MKLSSLYNQLNESKIKLKKTRQTESISKNRNSENQEVPEPGEYATNVYLKDCPFMLGKDQVKFFKIMQNEKEQHTITSVDDFSKNAKKKNLSEYWD